MLTIRLIPIMKTAVSWDAALINLMMEAVSAYETSTKA
jgi:hypothetical protein